MTDIIRQNENLCVKKCIVLFVYLLIKENLYLKLYLYSSKIGINAFIWEPLCAGKLIGRGAYARSNTSVKEKVGLSAGGGGLIAGEIRIFSHFVFKNKITLNKLYSVPVRISSTDEGIQYP